MICSINTNDEIDDVVCITFNITGLIVSKVCV